MKIIIALQKRAGQCWPRRGRAKTGRGRRAYDEQKNRVVLAQQ
jgi:hypothetical protein